ncbi:tyrosinase [Mycena albidolilacea]|uniref:Tyrosinase n=1 Tax=Mycena albidolilacea TaxID=1033008 RepID=A0AAD6ZH33_9AGAR|nr:tyrosinase [Mycena albidolilacea]
MSQLRRDLTSQQKIRFLGAVKCLQTLPARGLFTAARTRFDDFQAVHIDLTDEINFVETLRNECGFTGALPYWDWSWDVDVSKKIDNSPVFDPVYGFGGNGIDTSVSGAGGGCITTGPFASYNLSLGPSTTPTNHCITRAFSNMFVSSLSSAQIASTTKQQTFENFRIEVEGFSVPPTLKAHDGGHFSVGGEMRDRSCVLPTSRELGSHFVAVAAARSEEPSLCDIWALECRSSFCERHSQVWIEDVDLAPLVPIRAVMDTESWPLCYKYI